MRAYLTKPRLFYVLTILNIDIHFGSTQYICTADEFDCGRHCIPKDLVCDGNRDCIYGNDETGSVCTPPCAPYMFACADDKKCISKSGRCDGSNDCDDGSDESESLCSLPCPSDMFTCADGFNSRWGSPCIALSKTCDGDWDCFDYSDESVSLCPCSDDQFACADGSRCISKSDLCDGINTRFRGCPDNSNNFPSQCDNCTEDTLFKCQVSGVDVCMGTQFKCDESKNCDSYADELVSECPDCVTDSSKFTCKIGSEMVCLSKSHQCNGWYVCDDGSDEDPSACDNCSLPGFTMACKDGSKCIYEWDLCNGILSYTNGCIDGSDESDSYSNCTFCTQSDYVPCPGFSGNCAKLCDGSPTCPDNWDELLSTCESNKAQSNNTPICSEEDGLYQCKDGSKCLRSELICNGHKDCLDGSDEDSNACATKKDFCYFAASTPLHLCDKGSCIYSELACSAQEKPLCEDGSDMAYELCKDKCYRAFPDVEDPYMWPCASGTKKCILHTSLCDGYTDCDDGSDEHNCPLVTQIGLLETLMICLAILGVSWIIFFALLACFLEHDQDSLISMLSSSDPTLPDQALTSFLLHPALSDMDNQAWNWQEVGEQLRLEVVFFNKDPQVLLCFLQHIEAQDAHPNIIYEVFNGFSAYLSSKGYDPIKVAVSMRQTIGHHRLAQFYLEGPPNFMTKKLFQTRKCFLEFENRGRILAFLMSSIRAVQTSISPFFLYLDYLKDVIFYLILRETVRRLEEVCTAQHFDCLAVSGTENDILTALMITICVSITLTSISAFVLRKRFFKTNFLLDLLFVVLSPILPVIYHIRLSQMFRNLNKQKTKLYKHSLLSRTKNIEALAKSLWQIKELEVGLETVTQILLLIGLACFYPYVFKAPSGQTYSYFFGVALLVLKGNYLLFFASLILSFFSPCWFYVNQTDFYRHGSLNMSKKLVLMVRNVLFFVARVFSITSAIFIPVIRRWNIFVANEGIDASHWLGEANFRIEFQKFFAAGLHAVTVDITINALFFGSLVLTHYLAVSLFRSNKLGESSLWERLLYLVSSFWLPLPFLTMNGVDKGDEKSELWFLVSLHSLENLLIVLASRIVYMQESYPRLFLSVDCAFVIVNILAVLVSVLYVSKLELYAGLPRGVLSTLPKQDMTASVSPPFVRK